MMEDDIRDLIDLIDSNQLSEENFNKITRITIGYVKSVYIMLKSSNTRKDEITISSFLWDAIYRIKKNYEKLLEGEK